MTIFMLTIFIDIFYYLFTNNFNFKPIRSIKNPIEKIDYYTSKKTIKDWTYSAAWSVYSLHKYNKLDINVWKLIKQANLHPRVNILQPGPGVGGHCIAVDPWFIVNSAPNEAKLIRTARLINDSKPDFILAKINQAVKLIEKKRSEIKIACLGLAFKPDIDDLRESPALNIARQINLMNFNEVLLVEPNINQVPKGFDTNSTKLTTIENAIKIVDIVVLLVDHIQFKSMDSSLLDGKQVIDTRGIWS